MADRASRLCQKRPVQRSIIRGSTPNARHYLAVVNLSIGLRVRWFTDAVTQRAHHLWANPSRGREKSHAHRFRPERALAAALAFVVLSVPPAHAEELTGTWQGTLTGDGQAIEFTVAFSEDGYALYEYKNNKGVVQTVELSAPGQVQFVPPGGGVRTVAVESVVKRPGGLSYVLHIRFERASGGYLDQRFSSHQYHYALTREGLRLRLVSRAASYIGDRGGPVGGAQKPEIVEGILVKLR
jgi:hypothetical protein